MKNYIILKGKRDRLVIHLDNEVDFLSLKDHFIEKIIKAKDYIGDSQLAIEFVNRKLSTLEENVLLDLLSIHTDLNILYLVSSDEKDDSSKTFRFIKEITEEGITKYHHGNLRSGNSIEYDGNVVIVGDVNPGAQVVASGNVLVFGYLNGTVHAGKNGHKKAFVGALYLNPVQLIIDKMIASPMQNEILDTNKIKRRAGFTLAYIKDKDIVVENY